MKSLRRVLVKRVFNAFITIVLIMSLNFAQFSLMPQDPALLMIPRSPTLDTQQIYEENIELFGLDKGAWEQFYLYVINTFKLDWGVSYSYREPVADLMTSALAWTALLLGISTALTFIIGMVLGKLAARKRGKPADVAITTFGIFFYGMPMFWFALILMVVFSIRLNWLPSGGYISPGELPFPLTIDKIADIARHLVLPVTALVIGAIAGIILIMRNSLIDVLTEDYITTAYAKGLTEGQVMKRHASPNARLPIVTTLAMDMAFILGGAFQIEWVFSYQGIGWLTIDAIQKSDFPLLQFVFLIGGAAVVMANLIADILLAYLDPRISTTGG